MGRRFALALSLLGCSALSLPAVAQERIVSIGPATTELIMALGGEQSLIATDVSSPEPKGLPRVGYHRALAAEGEFLLWYTEIASRCRIDCGENGGGHRCPVALRRVEQDRGEIQVACFWAL